jgi:hypothetical protein
LVGAGSPRPPPPLDVTETTAKTHLEHIFPKTGVTRQAELMR